MDEKKKGPDNKAAAIEAEYRREISQALGLVTELGVSMFSCLFIGVLLGKTLDRRFNTSPALLLTGALLGGAAAIRVLYDLAIKKWIKR